MSLGTVGDHPELLGLDERQVLATRGDLVWCLHCERWQPKTSLRLIDLSPALPELPPEGPIVVCGFEDCDGTLLDIWERDTEGRLGPPSAGLP